MTFFRFRTKQEKEREIALKQETLHLELENLEKDFRIFLFDRMNMRQMKVDACGEQFAFRQMRTDDFFSSQTIREYRDRIEKNALYTKNFKHAFEAFVDGNFSEAKYIANPYDEKLLCGFYMQNWNSIFQFMKKPCLQKANLPLFSILRRKILTSLSVKFMKNFRKQNFLQKVIQNLQNSSGV